MITVDTAQAERLVTWMCERHNIYTLKMAGAPKPWTADSIMRHYKFCNVYRELDRTTVWIRRNWRSDHEDVWFATLVARLVNRPTTLEALGVPLPWNAGRFMRAIHAELAAGRPAYSGAYVVSTNGCTMDKAEFLAERVLTPAWKHRKYIRPRGGDTLATFHARLTEHYGIGSFIGAQIVADVKYTSTLCDCPDWWTWAASGPGSRRGLNRVCNKPLNAPWKEAEWLSVLTELRDYIFGFVHPRSILRTAGIYELHAQDLQNCLCEFDKYERTRLGQGRPRSTYPGLK